MKISEGDVHPKCFHPIEKPKAQSSESSTAGAQDGVVSDPRPQNNSKPDDIARYDTSANMSIYSAMTFLGLNGLSNTVSEGKYFADSPADTHGTEIINKPDIVSIEPSAASSTSSAVITEPLSFRREGFALNSVVDPLLIDETGHSDPCSSPYLQDESESRSVDHSFGVDYEDKKSACLSADINSAISVPVSTTVRDAAAATNNESPQTQNNTSGNPLPAAAAGAMDICNAELSSEEIMSIIECDDELVDKYKYFQFTKQNPDARECPRCKALQMGSAATPSMTCGSCGCVYCFFHSGAHPNRTCEEYEKSIAPEVVSNVTAAQLMRGCVCLFVWLCVRACVRSV